MYIHTYTASFFIHILMDPSCFSVLVILNSAAMNIGVHVYFQISFFFNIYSEVEGLPRWC